jgi:3-isopropylmalate dehydratase small subunit
MGDGEDGWLSVEPAGSAGAHNLMLNRSGLSETVRSAFARIHAGNASNNPIVMRSMHMRMSRGQRVQAPCAKVSTFITP